jgi:tetratricopeptide (TPR) repeat protein
LALATPGYVIQAAAEELRTHGDVQASIKTANRAADWYSSRIGDEAKKEENRAGLGDALYKAERWEEARSVFEDLAREFPANIHYLGRLGTLAARRGDRTEALRIADWLKRYVNPDICGNQTFRSACILALLGDKDGAIALLREAIAMGYGGADPPDPVGYGLIFRHSMDLESLRGYPPFEDLIKPRG